MTNLSTGQVLYALNAGHRLRPASTTKLATAVAALHVLGPNAHVHHQVGRGGRRAASAGTSIVLVGGGDPRWPPAGTPAADYPQPATLQALAAATARALRARRPRRSGSATTPRCTPARALGARLAAGNYISTGNVTPITALEVDQGG